MSRKCAVCGGDTSILKNEHNRIVDFRLCGGECREKWFKWNKACKEQGVDFVTLYPRINGDKEINIKLDEIENKIMGLPRHMIMYDEFNEYVDSDMLDSGDIIEKLSSEAKERLKRIMINLYGKRL